MNYIHEIFKIRKQWVRRVHLVFSFCIVHWLWIIIFVLGAAIGLGNFTLCTQELQDNSNHFQILCLDEFWCLCVVKKRVACWAQIFLMQISLLIRKIKVLLHGFNYIHKELQTISFACIYVLCNCALWVGWN